MVLKTTLHWKWILQAFLNSYHIYVTFYILSAIVIDKEGSDLIFLWSFCRHDVLFASCESAVLLQWLLITSECHC